MRREAERKLGQDAPQKKGTIALKLTPKQPAERAGPERLEEIEASWMAVLELTRQRQIKDFYTAEEFGRRR